MTPQSCRDPYTNVAYPCHDEVIRTTHDGRRVHTGVCARCGERIPMPWDEPNRNGGDDR